MQILHTNITHLLYGAGSGLLLRSDVRRQQERHFRSQCRAVAVPLALRTAASGRAGPGVVLEGCALQNHRCFAVRGRR